MLKRVGFFLITAGCWLHMGLFATKGLDTQFFLPRGEKKYTLSICSLFKNERRYLKEWIEYHRLVGVDHFYLYNNGSTDYCKAVLAPYIERGIVTLIFWPNFFGPMEEEKIYKWALTTQISAYENAVKVRAIDETKWLAIVAIDEFLVPPQASTLLEILERYDDYSGVKLISDFFDLSLTDRPSKTKLVIEALTLSSPPVENIQKSVSKMIFRPDQTAGFTWPPYQCQLKDQEQLVTLRKREIKINHYANRDGKNSKNEQLIASGELAVEDQDCSIYRFIPELRKKMGYVVEWEQDDIHFEPFAFGGVEE